MTQPAGPPPFATVDDLQARLGDQLSAARRAQAAVLLQDASAYLRQAIGWQVYPPARTTLAWHASGTDSLTLPPVPVRPIEVRAGGAVELSTSWSTATGTLRALWGAWYGEVLLVADVGYTSPPPDLKAWACVLAAQLLAADEDLGTLSSGGVTASAIDDSRTGYTDSGEGVGLSLPGRVLQQLRAAYGGGVHVTGQ